MLGRETRAARYSLRVLENIGLVVSVKRRGARHERAAILNPNFFAHNALKKILDGLLTLHPDIAERARLMGKCRLNKRLKENWYKPHIHGPRILP